MLLYNVFTLETGRSNRVLFKNMYGCTDLTENECIVHVKSYFQLHTGHIRQKISHGGTRPMKGTLLTTCTDTSS